MPGRLKSLQSASVRLTFGKSLRLLCSADFQKVFDDAPFRASHQNFLILARFNHHPFPRLGLVIAKKHLRLAVQRNRVKRVIRESFRLQQAAFVGLDVIVLSRKGLQDLTNPTFNEQLHQQWQRIFKKARHVQNMQIQIKPDVKVSANAAAAN